MSSSARSLRQMTHNLTHPPPRSHLPELLDEPGHDPAELAANFRDIRRVNQLLGGTALILRHLPRLLAAVPDAARRTVYLSGPPSMVAALRRTLRRAGARRIHTDVFVGY